MSVKANLKSVTQTFERLGCNFGLLANIILDDPIRKSNSPATPQKNRDFQKAVRFYLML